MMFDVGSDGWLATANRATELVQVLCVKPREQVARNHSTSRVAATEFRAERAEPWVGDDMNN